MHSSPDATRPTLRNQGGMRMVLCLVLLLMSGAEFIVRGPLRAVGSSIHFNDFLSPYIQARALVEGLDPYSPQVLLRLWPEDAPHFVFLAKEVANGSLVANRGIPTAYPITALVLIAPFAFLPWKFASLVWLGINLISFAIMLGALVALAGFSYRDPSAILLVAATLALAPFHTGIVTCNVTLVAVELSVMAIWTARQRFEMTTACLLAVATGLKPQIGLCFLLYYLLRRRWRICGIAFSLLACMVGIGLLRLELGHTPWIADYFNDNRILLETGVLGNFTAINPTRFGLINLQVALYPILGSMRVTNEVCMAIGAILLVAWIVNTGTLGASRTKLDAIQRGDCELLDLSAIAVISLLPVYHRFYDATLLVLPLCWAFVALRRTRTAAVISLLFMLPFTIPGGTLLQTKQIEGSIPVALTRHWWWEAAVMPHQVWALLFLSVLLLAEMRSCRRIVP